MLWAGIRRNLQQHGELSPIEFLANKDSSGQNQIIGQASDGYGIMVFIKCYCCYDKTKNMY